MKTMKQEKDGWTKRVIPEMKGYRMACCDCGLVHDLVFTAIKVVEDLGNGSFAYRDLDPKKYRVVFKARRNNRSTAAIRRKK